MKMRRVEEALEYDRVLHDLLLIIGRKFPTVEELQHFIPRKLRNFPWIEKMQKNKLVKVTTRTRTGGRDGLLVLTEKGYAVRGVLEDVWDLMPDVIMFSVYKKFPPERWRLPRAPQLLSPLSTRYKKMEKYFESRWNAEVRKLFSQKSKPHENIDR